MGCFKNSEGLRKEFRKILFVDPYKKSSAYSFSDYLFDIVCRCASATKADKFQYFALSSKGTFLSVVSLRNVGPKISVDLTHFVEL